MIPEGWFAVLATVMLVLAVGAGVVATADGDSPQEVRTPSTPTVDAPATTNADGLAIVDDERFESVQAAVDAADAGDTVLLEGNFEERVRITTPNLSVRTAPEATAPARLDGGGVGSVLTIDAADVSVTGLWISGSGDDRTKEDAGVRVNGSGATISNVHISDSTFGIWINGVPDVTVNDSAIVGSGTVPSAERGNGIHLWQADGAEIHNNSITQVRDGIYYQWSSGVLAENNRMWDLRYGVHYMYSDDNRLEGNVAFGNDVGFALMVSENLSIVNNIAVDNRYGPSQHGILVKDIDDSEIRGNAVIGNGNGFFVYNAQDNRIADNLIMENDRGIQLTAGSGGVEVVGNSFINNDRPAFATTTDTQLAWNDSEQGNYWSDARTSDLNGDGTSEIRHQPAGTVEQVLHQNPQAAVFAESPAFDAVRLAESSFPVLEAPGVVDHHPLTEPPHDDWETYYDD